jgi:hypothetical protein
MVDAVNGGGPRVAAVAASASLTLTASTHSARLARGAISGRIGADTHVIGPASLADLAPALRPIGAAMVFSGFDPSVDQSLRRALVAAPAGQSPSGASRTAAPNGRLRPGDPVGMSLIHGDFEMGATGTVTHVAGNQVYAFGHPFLNLGPTSFAMTQARVFTILPSLDSSMKIATLGPVIGTMTQDRATAVGGTLGTVPRELDVNLTLSSGRGPDRRFSFSVLHDQVLTPLFSYVAILNALVATSGRTV